MGNPLWAAGFEARIWGNFSCAELAQCGKENRARTGESKQLTDALRQIILSCDMESLYIPR